MATVRDQKYHHRRNEDGSYNAICPGCFLTVAHARTDHELLSLEREHVCDSSLLAERGLFQDRSELQRAL